MIPPNASLVKYDNPVSVSRNTDKKTPRAKALKVGSERAVDDSAVPSPPPKAKLHPIEGKANQQTEEILNSILPPREWSDSGQMWVQQVSNTPATRLDVVKMQDDLDKRLQQRQARETGICPVRRELYSQIFDELIRQVTINSAERGLLLLRVRDEIRMTIAAYQTLYGSSVVFGTRKTMESEQGKSDVEREIMELEQEKREMEKQVNELKARSEQIEKRAAEQRQVDDKKHNEEIQFLKRTNQQLKTQLEGIIAPKK